MGRHQENPVRLYFFYDPIANKSRCQIEGCTAEITGNHAGNLQRHVQRIHPSAFARLLSSIHMEDLSMASTSSSKRSFSAVDSERTMHCIQDTVVIKRPRDEQFYVTPDSIMDACVELVTVNGRPFSLMDDTGFRKILGPVLDIMGKSVRIDSNIVRNMVSEVAERERENLRFGLKGKLLMLKVDAVTYRDRSVLGINVQFTEGEHIVLRTLAVKELHERHTGSYISSVVREVLKTYDIDIKQLYSITVDDGVTMPEVMSLLMNGDAEYNGDDSAERTAEVKGPLAWGNGDGLLTLDIYETSGNVTGEIHSVGSGGPILRGVRCSAQVFHLAVDDALQDTILSSLVSKARRLSAKLQTPNVSVFLRRLGVTTAIVDRPSTWLSTHDMLQHLCQLRTFCQDMAPNIEELHLKGSEWEEMVLLVCALKPAKVTARLFQSEQLTAGDFFGAWLKCKIETDKIGGPFATLLVECLNRRQHMLFENEPFLAAVFLDPRYKVLLTEAQTEQAKSRLCNAWGMIQALSQNKQQSLLSKMYVESSAGDADDEIEEMLRARERENGDEGTRCKVLMMSMLNVYSSEARLKREENIFREMAECTTLDSLLEMGFNRNRAEKALAHTGNQGIERAMDWLMEHESDPDIDEPYVPPVGNVLGSTENEQSPPQPSPDPTTGQEGEMRPEGKRPMTEEEKQEQIKRLEELMKVKQEERRERERQEEVDREKQRRKQGQELLQVKQKMQEDEMKKLTDQRRREKMEDRMAKQRVREKIARDREERAQKFGGGSSGAVPSSPPAEAVPSSPPGSQGPPPAKKDYDECRIQVRLLDGSALTAVFKAQEPLAAVRVYVQMNGVEGQDFTLLSPYPRRVYTDLDMEKPLRELGLVPSAVLVVAKK
ncbi:hypothetical protein SKAU_G00369730 [Synaphobranchus kaupii]|uniref:UBX domain-containing protein 1 n=1 Tax=Synaphobranchus kaupii TaxID=118154 RepID=A0A9Q1EFV4_SYNKA|nr:hypothetical protein SKAU_G00369730 [Synaphobranchus kaupii]